jgi:ribosomal protein S12 methylthiotransferase
MLVGFPGETEEDFRILCEYIKEMKFERLGVFTYSHEEDTPAYVLEDDIAEDLKNERASELMEIQEDISFQKNLDKISKRYKVLIDRKEGGFFIGRTEYDSPEVDNEVLIDATKYYARVGDFVEIEVVNADAYDLHGKVIS